MIVLVYGGACVYRYETFNRKVGASNVVIQPTPAQSKEQQEADALMQNLQTHFFINPTTGAYWDTNYPTNVKVKPGEIMHFFFLFKNLSQKPFPAGTVKVIVRPGKYLTVQMYKDGQNSFDTPICKQFVRQLTTTGFDAGEILPFASQYYSSGSISIIEINYAYHFMSGFGGLDWVVINPQAPPGNSVTYTGYISINGHEKQVGSTTVDIIYQ
jgi:hypothetical protein